MTNKHIFVDKTFIDLKNYNKRIKPNFIYILILLKNLGRM